MEGIIFIGIDVSQQSNSVHVMDQSGNKLWQRTLENSLLGSQEIEQQLLETKRNRTVSFFNFGLEATGCYGDQIAMFLRETDQIPRSEKVVRLLTPSR